MNEDMPIDNEPEFEQPDVDAQSTGQTETTENQPEGEQSEGEKQDEQPKPKSRAEQRIAELVAERNAERQRAAELEAKLNQPQQSKSNDGAPAAPNIDDFDLSTDNGLNDWLKAQADYDEQAKRYEFEKFINERETQKQQAERQSQIENDFKQAFERNPQFKDNFAQLIERHEHTPLAIDPSQVFSGQELMDVLDTLATDEELYFELAGLSQAQQLMKLGAIQAGLKARGNTPPPVTKAPTPPNHTKQSAPITRDVYELSDSDFLKKRGLS